MSIRSVNGAVFMIWSLTYYNPRHMNIEKDTTPVQRIYRNLN